MNNQQVSKEVLNILQNAKEQSHLDKEAIKMGKLVNKALSNCEIEIAKAIAIMNTRGDMNLTPEVIKLLTSICVATVMRYIDLPEDQRVFLDALHENIEGLYKFVNEKNEQEEEQL